MDPTKLKQNLRVFWKLMNPHDCVWENHYRNIMRTILQKRRQFITALQFGSQIYSYASSDENSCSTSSCGQGMGKLEKISAWNLTKVRSKKEVIDEARTSGAKVHFASLMDICHLKMLNWRQNTESFKVRLYSEVIL